MLISLYILTMSVKSYLINIFLKKSVRILKISRPNTILSLKKMILAQFCCADSEPVFRFFPARKVYEITFSESSKNTENAPIEWLQKETTRYFLKTKVYVIPSVLSLVFKTVFGIFLTPPVCLKSVK
jgi:hypothetical protein